VDEIIESYVLNPAIAYDLGVDPKAPGLREELEKTDPKAWWDYNKDRSLALGIGETLNVVRGALEKQRFDGVFGFSQGAALAAIISALLERPEVYPAFIHEGKPIHPPLEFCIAVSGFRLIDPVVAKIFSTSFKTPIMHIIGRKDSIVRSVRSQPLIDLSEKKRVIVHEDAHIVPLTATWTAFYCDFIQGSSFDIPAPVPAVGKSEALDRSFRNNHIGTES